MLTSTSSFVVSCVYVTASEPAVVKFCNVNVMESPPPVTSGRLTARRALMIDASSACASARVISASVNASSCTLRTAAILAAMSPVSSPKPSMAACTLASVTRVVRAVRSAGVKSPSGSVGPALVFNHVPIAVATSAAKSVSVASAKISATPPCNCAADSFSAETVLVMKSRASSSEMTFCKSAKATSSATSS